MASSSNDKKKPTRVWVDGCFDMMHFGHANALRQAREMGDVLVVGVHSDEEIAKNKGPVVMKEKERYAAVAACKWADEVVPNAPYMTMLDVLDKYNCDFCVHGDDITTMADGTDSYALVKNAGRFKECKRTMGVSTTELVGRMLLMTRQHHQGNEAEKILCEPELNSFSAGCEASPYTGVSRYLATTKRLLQFSSMKEPKPNDKVVYVDGGFDLFHAGHSELFKEAKALGDYLLVGIHDDQTINRIKGANYPLMNLNERVLSVLSCKYVDEVIIGAPYTVSKEVLEKVYQVSLVVHGKAATYTDMDGSDPYAYPKSLGIYREVDTAFSYLTTEVIIDRIIIQRQLYEERNRKKEAKELALLKNLAQTQP